MANRGCSRCKGKATPDPAKAALAMAAAMRKFEVECVAGPLVGKYGVTWPFEAGLWFLIDEDNIAWMIQTYQTEMNFRTTEEADLFKLRNGF